MVAWAARLPAPGNSRVLVRVGGLGTLWRQQVALPGLLPWGEVTCLPRAPGSPQQLGKPVQSGLMDCRRPQVPPLHTFPTLPTLSRWASDPGFLLGSLPPGRLGRPAPRSGHGHSRLHSQVAPRASKFRGACKHAFRGPSACRAPGLSNPPWVAVGMADSWTRTVSFLLHSGAVSTQVACSAEQKLGGSRGAGGRLRGPQKVLCSQRSCPPCHPDLHGQPHPVWPLS